MKEEFINLFYTVSHAIYDKVVEFIQLINCCITYKHGVNVFFITIIHVDLLLSFALFTWVIIRIFKFHLCSKTENENVY